MTVFVTMLEEGYSVDIACANCGKVIQSHTFKDEESATKAALLVEFVIAQLGGDDDSDGDWD